MWFGTFGWLVGDRTLHMHRNGKACPVDRYHDSVAILVGISSMTKVSQCSIRPRGILAWLQGQQVLGLNGRGFPKRWSKPMMCVAKTMHVLLNHPAKYSST